MKKFVIAAAMAAVLSTPALATDLKNPSDDLVILSTQGVGVGSFGGVGVAGSLALATLVVTALSVGLSSSATGS